MIYQLNNHKTYDTEKEPYGPDSRHDINGKYINPPIFKGLRILKPTSIEGQEKIRQHIDYFNIISISDRPKYIELCQQMVRNIDRIKREQPNRVGINYFELIETP